MKNLLALFTFSLFIFSCAPDDDSDRYEYDATQIHRIPYGQSATMSAGNYSGKGNITNVAGTTVKIEGYTTVDALSINGKVKIPSNATLVVNDVLNVGGGAEIDIDGTLICKTLTQVGDVYLSNGFIKVNGKYTIGGGTVLYLENSKIELDELVITGHIQAIENAVTQAANWYSVIEFTGSKYLNRSAGNNVCGPLLFTINTDNGSTASTLVDVTSDAVQNNINVRVVYGISDSAKLYQYDDNCTPLAVMPN